MTHRNNDPDDHDGPPDTPPPSTITAAGTAPSDDREVIEIGLTEMQGESLALQTRG